MPLLPVPIYLLIYTYSLTIDGLFVDVSYFQFQPSLMHQSIPAVPIPRQPRGICLRCQSRGWGSRGPFYFLQVEVRSTFCNKISTMLPVLSLQGNLFRNKITFLALLIVFIDNLSLRDFVVAGQSERGLKSRNLQHIFLLRDRLCVGCKTRNIAFRLVSQQCGQTSWTFELHLSKIHRERRS